MKRVLFLVAILTLCFSSSRAEGVVNYQGEIECGYSLGMGGNATGRVLLANAPSEVKLRIIDRLGLPSPQEWQAGSENQEALLAELEKIRRENHADLFCNGARNYYIAATVPGAAAGLMPLAIGLGLPGAQSEKKEFFLKLLFQAVKRLE